MDSNINIRVIQDRILAEAEKISKQEPSFDTTKMPHKRLVLVSRRPNLLRRVFTKIATEKWGIFKKVYRLPGIGYALKWTMVLLRLPTRISQLYEISDLVLKRICVLENGMFRRLDSLEQDVGSHFRQLDELGTNCSRMQREIDSGLQERINLVETCRNLEGAIKQNRAILDLTKARLASAELDFRQADITPSTHPTTKGNSVISHLEHFYTAFENHFRGERLEIKKRFEKYIPYLRETGVDFNLYPVVDIGCGRGEWIELMKEQKIEAFGIDLNESMVQLCNGLNLKSHHQDLFEFFSSQPDRSISVITAFHVVEHLPFDKVLLFFAEALRILVDNGLIITETPNPENLRVGSCNFYTDPTHNNPIPPHTLSFVADYTGYRNIKVVRSSPANELPTDLGEGFRALVDWANKETDYAIVAQK